MTIGSLRLKTMLFYLNCTANLGDFLNSLPVFSGISKRYPISLIIRHEMAGFNGIIDFLLYQGIFENVYFDNQEIPLEPIFPISSWTREDKSDDNIPTETCRYENWVKDNYKLLFDVDQNFIVRVPDYSMEVSNSILCGDRWVSDRMDTRRNSNVLCEFDKLTFLDFSKPLLENSYIIKNNSTIFVSTFTGVSILADLLNKPQYVVWQDELANWDNKPIAESFAKHYFKDRNSRLINIKDFRVEYDRLFY